MDQERRKKRGREGRRKGGKKGGSLCILRTK